MEAKRAAKRADHHRRRARMLEMRGPRLLLEELTARGLEDRALPVAAALVLELDACVRERRALDAA